MLHLNIYNFLIKYGLFYGCSKLKCLDIPGSVEKISQFRVGYSDTFYSCSRLSRLSIMQSSQSLIVGGNDYFDSWLSRSWESWTENIKELYVDRELESYIPVPNLVKLEIGKSIQKIPVSSISSISTLDTIYSYAKVPPTLPSMTNKHYINTIVKVPADALDAYKNANN